MAISVKKLANRLTFRQLQVFQAVFELESYSKAGEQLGLTQPAVSSQMRQLEQALEAPLFEYIGRRLYRTAAGIELAASIDVIFNELRKLQTDLAAMKGEVAGELKLVAVSTAQYVVPYLLRAFLNLHPQVSVRVRVVNRATAIQRLNDNTDDLVIMGMVPLDKPFTSLPFLDNELVPVVPDGHPLLQQPHVTVTEFLGSQLLLREAGSGSRLALEVHCQEQNLRLRPAIEMGSNEAVKHAVMAGLGVAVLPRLGILPELELGLLRVIELPGFPLRRSWSVVYPLAKHLTPAMRAFLDYIQQNIKQLEMMFMRRTRSKSDSL
jgi:DNA-binding transcriptional LysR family regulator